MLVPAEQGQDRQGNGQEGQYTFDRRQAPRHLTKMSDPEFGISGHFRRMNFGRFRGVPGALRSDLRPRRIFRRTMDQTSAATTLLDRQL